MTAPAPRMGKVPALKNFLLYPIAELGVYHERSLLHWRTSQDELQLACFTRIFLELRLSGFLNPGFAPPVHDDLESPH
ncbi:hypothetical protein V496_06728 [Pseudogymnoascus sp. VKM F-4515 (FW-2607)]|nr:hypothetical protein V496_06728 [Pseudogymnoascus sp. VKM F-4515 (FW-2607)]